MVGGKDELLGSGVEQTEIRRFYCASGASELTCTSPGFDRYKVLASKLGSLAFNNNIFHNTPSSFPLPTPPFDIPFVTHRVQDA